MEEEERSRAFGFLAGGPARRRQRRRGGDSRLVITETNAICARRQNSERAGDCCRCHGSNLAWRGRHKAAEKGRLPDRRRSRPGRQRRRRRRQALEGAGLGNNKDSDNNSLTLILGVSARRHLGIGIMIVVMGGASRASICSVGRPSAVAAVVHEPDAAVAVDAGVDRGHGNLKMMGMTTAEFAPEAISLPPRSRLGRRGRRPMAAGEPPPIGGLGRAQALASWRAARPPPPPAAENGDGSGTRTGTLNEIPTPPSPNCQRNSSVASESPALCVIGRSKSH